MGVIGKDFNYKIIPNFLGKEEMILLNQYCEIFHRTNSKYFDITGKQPVGTDTCDTSSYGDPLFDSLLLTKKNIMEEATGKKLFPTYSYWRMHTKHAVLRKHIDRDACEISVTIHIGSDGTSWPFYLDGNLLNTKPGDAIIYLGPKLMHYREIFKGDWYLGAFLHYVDAEGPHKDQYMDKRMYWGTKKIY